MIKYHISSAAINDLNQISDYLAEININLAEKFIKKFSEKCKNLVNFPNMGKRYDEIMPNLRGIILDKYIIFYLVSLDEINIVRVVSGYQDLDLLFLNNNDN